MPRDTIARQPHFALCYGYLSVEIVGVNIEFRSGFPTTFKNLIETSRTGCG